MSERIRGGYDDALYKSTFTLLYFTDVIDSIPTRDVLPRMHLAILCLCQQ